MTTNMTELNLNELEQINGGDFLNHVVGVGAGMGIGAAGGIVVGGVVGGTGGALNGMMIGAPIGAVVGGIVGIEKIADKANSIMHKIVSWF